MADLDYRRLVRDSKRIDISQHRQQLRVALLSDAATQQFVPLLKTLFHENGVGAQFYEAPFDAIELEVINPQSGLYAFKPDVAVFLHSTQALRARYYQPSGHLLSGDHEGAQRGRMLAAEQKRNSREALGGEPDTATVLPDFSIAVARLWDMLAERATCRIIQCNFPLPYERPFGQFDLKLQQSFYTATQQLNTQLADAARQRSGVLLCDLESVASYIGRKHWFDDRLWDMSKTFCALEHLPAAAQALVDLVMASLGRVVKCVVLDLDNTLWGGVVGDLGPLGIQIGPHGDGEAFYRFQQYLLSLKRRGILLAVCSKNDPANALAPFEKNPDMLLTREDITVFIANWENKADNIRQIRDTLEIGLDSMVFLDDNPFERNLVRNFLPAVIVPELPEDPADYVRAISELNLFETTSFSAEDVSRAALYKQEAERREAQTTYTDVTEFLKSLDMRITLGRFESSQISRVSQLFLRSNQFNLTTHRYSEAECEAMLRNEACIPLQANLSDRFGDHGLISIVVAWPEGDTLRISDWLMSCRVLGRGVEQYLMNHIFTTARDLGLSFVSGDYIPTPKNAMVKDFWAQFGFEPKNSTTWRKSVDAYAPATVWIRENTSVWTPQP